MTIASTAATSLTVGQTASFSECNSYDEERVRRATVAVYGGGCRQATSFRGNPYWGDKLRRPERERERDYSRAPCGHR